MSDNNEKLMTDVKTEKTSEIQQKEATAETQITAEAPAEENVTEEAPVEENSSEEMTAEEKIAEEKTTEEKTTEEKTYEEKTDEESSSGEQETETAVEHPENEPALEEQTTDAFIDEQAFRAAENKTNIRKKILVGAAVTVISAYLIMVILCSFLYYPMTKVNDKDISLMSPEYAASLIERDYDNYYIKLVFRDGEEIIKGSDIDLSVSAHEYTNHLHKTQNPFMWFSAFYDDGNYIANIQVTYNVDKLERYLQDLKFLDEGYMRHPEEPEIVLERGKVVVKTGDAGNYIDYDIFKDNLEKAILSLNYEMNVDEMECYATPEYTPESQEVIEAVEKLEKYLDTDITLTIDKVAIDVEKEDIMNMINVNSDYFLKLDKGKVRDYVMKLEDEYNTLGTERKFKTTKGDYVQVVGEAYGWDIDEDVETDELYINILSGNSVSREVNFVQQGYTYDSSGDIGETYIEVDLSNQHMYLYKDGIKVFESDLVSGCKNRGNTTPGGLYAIKYKARNVVLRGDNYASPVSYWMPFNGGIGFHDANWRSSFGGDIYVTNGSHGCVNMPVSKAGEFYNLIETGMPVVCYWR